jgi:hypothetical protein
MIPKPTRPSITTAQSASTYADEVIRFHSGLSPAAVNLSDENTVFNPTVVTCERNNSTGSATLTFYHFELHVLIFLITILSCSSFIHMYFYSKLVLMFVALIVYAVGFNLNKIYECLADSIHEDPVAVHIRHISFLKAQIFIQMFFYVMFLHLIDRRVS